MAVVLLTSMIVSGAGEKQPVIAHMVAHIALWVEL